MNTKYCPLFIVAALMAAMPGFAWDYEGHKMVTEVALQSLPADFPAFAKTDASRDRITFVCGEPDRWRVSGDPALRQLNEPDHYLDLEGLIKYGWKPHELPDLRNQLIEQMAVYRDQHADQFRPIRAGHDPAHTRELFGLLAYAINENFLKLRADFIMLKLMEDEQAPQQEIADQQASILYTMGILAHFAGDGSQPLHVTEHHHGWVGPNPNGYTQDPQFHAWVDGGFIKAAGILYDGLTNRVKPACRFELENVGPNENTLFSTIFEYLKDTHQLVKPLYQLEHDGKLNSEKPSPEGKQFIEDQLLRGGEYLGNLYYTAYVSAMVPAPQQSPPYVAPVAWPFVEPKAGVSP